MNTALRLALVSAATLLATLCIASISSANKLYVGINANTRSWSNPGDEMDELASTATDRLREDLEWQYVEPVDDEWNWEHTDSFYSAAAERHMNILPILDSPPCWAVPATVALFEPNNCWQTYPVSDAEFAEFTAEAVKRYGPGGDFWDEHPEFDSSLASVHFEIWNEPYYKEFTNNLISPKRYAELYKAAVVSGRLANGSSKYLVESTADATLPNGKEWVNWPKGMVSAIPGIGAYIDGIAIHPYPGGHLSSYEPISGTDESFKNTDRIFKEWSDLGIIRPIWITEVGYSACNEIKPEDEDCIDAPTLGERESLKATRLLELFNELKKAPYGYVHAVYLYNLREGGSPSEPNATASQWFGIIDKAGNHLPAFEAFRVATLPELNGPPQPLVSLVGSTIGNSTATFSFTVTDPTSSTECKLNAAAWAPCSSPKTYSGLGNGLYTFEVKARNAEGFEGRAPAYRWSHLPPSVTTEAASGVKRDRANLTASINPQATSTTYKFQYGPTAAYGSSLPASGEVGAGSGTSAITVSGFVWVPAGTTYHYRVVAKNANGTSYGSDRTVTTPPEAAAPKYVSSFGSPGSGAGQFNKPTDLAVTSTGDLWVVDRLNHRLQKISSAGGYLAQIGGFGTGNGQLRSPTGIAIDLTGDIWVADTNNRRLEKFGTNGEYLAQCGAGQFSVGPYDVAVGANNEIWAADGDSGRVLKFDASCSYASVMGSPQVFSKPYALGVDAENHLWVADESGYNRVVKILGVQEPLLPLRETFPVGPSSETDRLTGLGIGKGMVWIPKANGRIDGYSEVSGDFVTHFGSSGSGPGQFSPSSWRSGVAVTPSGDIWVTDPGNSRVQLWR